MQKKVREPLAVSAELSPIVPEVPEHETVAELFLPLK